MTDNTCTALVPLTAEQKAYGSLIVRQTKAARRADLGQVLADEKTWDTAQLAVEKAANKINAHGGRLVLKKDDDGTQYLTADARTLRSKEAHLWATRAVVATDENGKQAKAPNVYALYQMLVDAGVKLPKLAKFPNGQYVRDGVSIAKALEARGLVLVRQPRKR